jgi:predicted outer membrane repeat protein
MNRLALTLSTTLLVLVNTVSARTWYIMPDGTGDAPTIQAGIDSATTGDEVVLANGTFGGPGNRDIDYHGKAVTVRSESGDPAMCIVDCPGDYFEPHRGFYFNSGEGPGSVLEGVTITNAWAGGGLPDNLGGGVYCKNQSSPTIANCFFIRNHAERGGGAISCRDYSSPTLTNCVLASNSAGWYGGGLRCEDYSSPTFTNCTFWGNSAHYGGGVYCISWSSPILLNTIITLSTDGEAVYCYDGYGTCDPNLGCCDLYGNVDGDWVGCVADQCDTNGNFSACPSFCFAGAGDFHLCDGSPCAPGNHPDGYGCGLIGALDVGCSCGPTATETATWSAIKSRYQ